MPTTSTTFNPGDNITGRRRPLRGGGAATITFAGEVIEAVTEGDLTLVIVRETSPRPGSNVIVRANWIHHADKIGA